MTNWNGWAIRADPKNEYILIHEKHRRKVPEYKVIHFANEFLGANAWEIKGAIKAIKEAPNCGVIKVYRDPPTWYAWEERKTREEIEKEWNDELKKGFSPYYISVNPFKSFWCNAITGEEITKTEMNSRLDKGEIKPSELGTIDDCYKNLK